MESTSEPVEPATAEEAIADVRARSMERTLGSYKQRLIDQSKRHYGVTTGQGESEVEGPPQAETSSDSISIYIEGVAYKVPKDPAMRDLLDEARVKKYRQLNGSEPGSYASRLIQYSRKHFLGQGAG